LGHRRLCGREYRRFAVRLTDPTVRRQRARYPEHPRWGWPPTVRPRSSG
jgi:CRISPR/Cas system endoribonuclease Cas6 (RAMP superfamily)